MDWQYMSKSTSTSACIIMIGAVDPQTEQRVYEQQCVLTLSPVKPSHMADAATNSIMIWFKDCIRGTPVPRPRGKQKQRLGCDVLRRVKARLDTESTYAEVVKQSEMSYHSENNDLGGPGILTSNRVQLGVNNHVDIPQKPQS